MAWDIYGQPLRRGHCEVHPHIAEPWPCPLCLSEHQQPEQPYPDPCQRCSEIEGGMTWCVGSCQTDADESEVAK